MAMEQLAALVIAETAQQNLIAPSTVGHIWNRHIVDSAQLLSLCAGAEQSGLWIDIGSGAGFPGLVVAALSRRPVMLVEPRKRRASFLACAVEEMGLGHTVTVRCDRIENVAESSAVISARAVATLAALFEAAEDCSQTSTRWILPKGRNAREEVASARKAWHGKFHVEHSITDPDSLIVLASGVARR
jgi:16S rRNA (guanine527-N7)-methyltransferase